MATDEDVPERRRSQAWFISLWGVQAGAREEIKTSMECRSPVRHTAQRDNKGTQQTPSPYQNTLLVLARLLEGFTHQPYNPVGLDLELLNQPLKNAPESPRTMGPGASSFRVSPGPDSAALGPAIYDYTVDGFTRLSWKISDTACTYSRVNYDTISQHVIGL